MIARRRRSNVDLIPAVDALIENEPSFGEPAALDTLMIARDMGIAWLDHPSQPTEDTT